MPKLNRNYILPAVAVWASLCCSCQAQVYSTNTIGHVQTINLAARLKKGMTQEQVKQFLAANKLYCGMTVDGKAYPSMGAGNNIAWNESIILADNWSLTLDYSGNDWGLYGESSLEGAYVQSNSVNTISIPLVRPAKESAVEKKAGEAEAREAQYERWVQTNLASGYFQEKTFVLSNRAPDEAALSVLFDHDRGKVAYDGGGMGTVGTNILQITASTNDMIIWDRVVKEFDQPTTK